MSVNGRNDAARHDIKKAMIYHPQHKKYFVMRRLNLNHLHTFSLVIAHGSFSAAAERLHLTQPAVSLHYKEQRHSAWQIRSTVAQAANQVVR